MAIVYFELREVSIPRCWRPQEVSYHNIQKKAPSRYFCRFHSFNAKTGFTRNQSPLNGKQVNIDQVRVLYTDN